MTYAGRGNGLGKKHLPFFPLGLRAADAGEEREKRDEIERELKIEKAVAFASSPKSAAAIPPSSASAEKTWK